MSTPTESDAHLPPISPEDARFYALKHHDDATTLSAWQTLEAELRALTETPSGLPKVDLDHAATEVIRLAPTLAKLRAPTLALLSDTQALKTARALDALPRLAFALLYVLRQDAKATPDGPSLADLNKEGTALRARGLAWCNTLENLGSLPVGTARTIRKGRPSYRETAADLQDLFDALHPLRAQLAALQTLATEPLTDADIDRMTRLSTLLHAAISEAKSPLDWRVALLRLAARFERDYRVSYASAQLHLALNEDPTELPTFNALRRPATKTSPPAPDAPPSA